MSERNVQLVILCEDEQHQTFFWRFFKKRKFNMHRVRVVISPAGGGSAEQFVREKYANEVEALRRQGLRMKTALCVVIDADAGTLADHHKELANQLKNRSIPLRTVGEAIGIFVPKWNIETWIHFLRDKEVVETEIYPRFPNASDCQTAVDRLVELLARGSEWPPLGCPDSLNQSKAEFDRLP